jgi:hypothetical protein
MPAVVPLTNASRRRCESRQPGRHLTQTEPLGPITRQLQRTPHGHKSLCVRAAADPGGCAGDLDQNQTEDF